LRQLLYPRVRARVITPFLLAIMVVAAIGAFTMTRLVADSLQERFINQLFDSAHAASNTVVAAEQSLLETLRVMVFTRGVAGLVAAGDMAQLDAHWRPLAANAALDELNLYAPDGTGLLRLRRVSRPELPGIDYETPAPLDVQGWAGAMRVVLPAPDAQGDKFADLIQTDGGSTLFISAPIVDAGGAIIAGLSAGVRSDSLVATVAAQALSSVALYDAEGRLLASAFRLVTDEQLALTPEAAANLTQVVADTSPIVERSFDDTPFQILYAPLRVRGEQLGLLAVGLPSSFIIQQSSTSRDALSLLFALLAAVVMLLGSLISRTIIRPLNLLATTARAITSGDYSRRVALTQPDELGELSTHFNHMTAELVQRNEAITNLLTLQTELTAQLEAVLIHIADAVIFTDPSGTLLLENTAARSLRDRVSADEKARLDALVADVYGLREAQIVLFGANFYSAIASTVTIPSGTVIGHVMAFRDVTEIIRAEKLKDELILQMSHELRTPLAVLRGNVDLLRMVETPNLSDRGVRFLEKSVENLVTLERLINQVVDVSSITAGRLFVEQRPTDLGSLLKARADSWTHAMRGRNLRFEAALPEYDLCVEGDATRLGEIVDHVLRNAYAYTLPGGEVRLSAERVNGHVSIQVADSGVGIKPDELEHVFERMFRGSAAEAGPTDARGMGLGLYLARYLVEKHQGSIALRSTPGQGTVVDITLPAAAEAS
jgi:two-component system sensor histidine kinase VicK